MSKYEKFLDENILVPIAKQNSYYVCHLPTKNYTRRYTHDTLPPFLLIKLINIEVTESRFNLIFTNVGQLLERLKYLCENNHIDEIEFLELGFKIENEWYIVPLSKKEYESILGKNIDTRKKSKNKSKENIR
tara:strand:+ start:2181 stop:2576 length:396 start_codon:yes stop_codon:yes gene_type:complete